MSQRELQSDWDKLESAAWKKANDRCDDEAVEGYRDTRGNYEDEEKKAVMGPMKPQPLHEEQGDVSPGKRHHPKGVSADVASHAQGVSQDLHKSGNDKHNPHVTDSHGQ